MKKKQSKRSRALRCLTLSAMLTALSVVVLYLGALLDVLSLSATALSSLFILFAVRELPLPYRLAVYFGTSLLALILLPTPESAVLYASLGGLYPLLKHPLERMRRPLPLILKLLYCNLLIAGSEIFCIFLLGMPPSSWYILLPLFLIGNPAFLLYDRMLDRLSVYYEARLRPRLARYL